MDKEKQLQTDREESREDESGDTVVLGGDAGGSAIVTGHDIYIQQSVERLAEISSRISVNTPLFSFSIRRNKPNLSQREESRLRQEQIKLIDQLSSLGIDPVIFDVMLSNELDRRLKRQFGLVFLTLTTSFTLLSYLVIIFNGVFKWGISELAITALIIETPLQFIGLLYIIARNLFPQNKNHQQQSGVRRLTRRAGLTKEPSPREEE